jgi:hypothetical protein
MALEEPRAIKLAVLMRPDVGDATFIENVAINRRVNMKVFTDKQKAEEWLLESISRC